MSKKYFYPVIFEPEEVGVSVYVPDIPGCNTQGDSLEEALEMVQEVIGLMLEGKKPEEYPQASKPNEINLEGNQFVMMVAFNAKYSRFREETSQVSTTEERKEVCKGCTSFATGF